MDRPFVLGDQRSSPLISGESIRDHFYRYSLHNRCLSTETRSFLLIFEKKSGPDPKTPQKKTAATSLSRRLPYEKTQCFSRVFR